MFCVGAIIASGVIADRIGRATLLIGSAIAIAAYSGFAPQLLDGGVVGETIYMIVGFVLLGLSFGQSSGAVASRFAMAHRYTASALTSRLRMAVRRGLCAAGGTRPCKQLRTDLCWRVSAVRRSLHPARADDQPKPRTA